MQLSGIVLEFEKVIKEYLAANYGKLDLSKPQYSIERLGVGQYQITLSITELGVQHFYVGMVGDEFSIKGKVALIGDKEKFPSQAFADLISKTFLRWLDRTMDSASVTTPGTAIKQVQAAPLTIPPTMVNLVGEVSVDVSKKPIAEEK